MPHLDYCVTVWGDCSEMNKLVKLQKTGSTDNVGLPLSNAFKDMFCKLKWLPMKDWVTHRKATMTFKAINGNAPYYISSIFKPVGVVHSGTTRKLVKMICIFRIGPSSMFSGIRYDTLVLKYGMIYVQT